MAKIPENSKHPIILPKSNHVTKLVIQYYHDKYLDGSVVLSLSAIRWKVRVVNGKSEIKKHIWICIRYSRVRAKT